MQQAQLDFFFFLGSTYTYLAVQRAEAAAEAAGVRLNWRPFSVRTLMIEQNNKPFVGKPEKTAYMWRDLERRAQRHGVPTAGTPVVYPIDKNDEQANRVATVAAMQGWCPEFTRAAYTLWFMENKDPGEPQNLAEVLRRTNRDPPAIIALADGEDARARYKAETDAARDRGLFGSPSFVCGREVFWGDDRLEDALDWCVAHTGFAEA